MRLASPFEILEEVGSMFEVTRSYLALASDYDGTLARQGRVEAETVHELQRWKGSGKKLILVTGRELGELLGAFPSLGVCDRVVAENGALLYSPATERSRLLGEPAPKIFIEELRRRGVAPLSVGRSIVSTVTPFDRIVQEVIEELQLSLQVIMNKESVMVLPQGIDKATGLSEALRELSIDPASCVAIGDADNDHALLDAVGLGAAVLNATEELKKRASIRLRRPDGEGVCELIRALLATCPQSFEKMDLDRPPAGS